MVENKQLQQEQLFEKLNMQTNELQEKYGPHFRADEYLFRGRMFIQNKGSLTGLDAKDFIDREALERELVRPSSQQKEEWQNLTGDEPDKKLTTQQLGEQLKNLRNKVKNPEDYAQKEHNEKIKHQIHIRQAVKNNSFSE